MKHKFTKILVFSFFLTFSSCGTTETERASDYSNEAELEIDNEKNIEYKPSGNYDTISNIEELAKDRRNHRQTGVDETKELSGDTTNEMNLHPEQEPHNAGPVEEEGNRNGDETQDANEYVEDNNSND